jgi:transposase
MKKVVADLEEGGTMTFPSIGEAARFYGVSVNTITKWIRLGRPCKGCHDRLFLKENKHERNT